MQANDTGWLVLGANGQIGRALQTTLATKDAVTFWGRDEADLSDISRLKSSLDAMQPTAIINAAAYTAVDKAEEEAELAHRINAEAVEVLAGYAKNRDIPLVHYSTDYVFDGSGDRPRTEDAPTGPLSVYGESKLAGEQAITQSGCDHLIFRTSWVYDATGKNFLNTMLHLGAERESLNVVNDQIGAPSFAGHLAEATVTCLEKTIKADAFPSGIYHLCNAGETSWHGFAEAIFELAKETGFELAIEQLSPIPTSAYPTPATRPLNSRLSMEKLQRVFDLAMPHWREGLADCMAQKKEAMDEAA